MKDEEKKGIINKVIEKFDRPKVRILNMVLLWAALIIMAYHFDMRFWEIQDFVNENCLAFEPMYFDVDLNATRPEINMSEIPIFPLEK